MKYIKKYEKISDNFIFAINIKNISIEKLNDIFQEFDKNNIFYYQEDKNEIIREIERANQYGLVPWAIIFNLYQSYNNYNEKQKKVSIVRVTSPGWGAGVEHMEYIITPDEFLSQGVENIENNINVKKNINKYNL